jgi:hypothetical protein
MATGTDLRVRVLFIEEAQGCWSAQCLDYDIAAQARSLSELHYEFERVLVAHVVMCQELQIDPFKNLRPAPQKFWRMYEEAKLSVEAEEIPFRMPHPAAIASVTPKMKIANRAVH